MDAGEIINTLTALGIDHSTISPFKGNIASTCPLAPWTHLKEGQLPGEGHDSTAGLSVKISPDEPSLFKCWSQSCGEQGLFKNLVVKVFRKLGKPHELADLVLKVLDREKVDFIKTLDRAGNLFKPRPRRIQLSPEAVEEKMEVWDEVELEAFQSLAKKSLFYKRGGTKAQAKRWGIVYDPYKQRVVFPIRRYDGSLVGLVGRATKDGQKRKYQNYWGFGKTKFLYGENFVPDDVPGLIVVEGMLDVIAVERAIKDHPKYGDFRPVGLFGSDFSPRQRKKLLSWRTSIYVFMDSDGAGIQGAKKVIEGCAGRTLVLHVDTPRKLNGRKVKDAGDMTPEEIIELLDNANPTVGEPIDEETVHSRKR